MKSPININDSAQKPWANQLGTQLERLDNLILVLKGIRGSFDRNISSHNYKRPILLTIGVLPRCLFESVQYFQSWEESKPFRPNRATLICKNKTEIPKETAHNSKRTKKKKGTAAGPRQRVKRRGYGDEEGGRVTIVRPALRRKLQTCAGGEHLCG